MDSDNTVCPVCTLYLRPGITLKSHLSSHPKQKVIEALVRLSNSETTSTNQLENKNAGTSTWNQNFPVAGNHSFIYQQFMSTSSPQPNVLNVNPLAQQYVTVPTVFSPQMMCPPYVYQQQQVIMSSGPALLPRPLPIEMPNEIQETVVISDVDEPNDDDKKSSDDEEKSERDYLKPDDDPPEKDEQGFVEQDVCYGSPASHTGSDWNVRVRSDLSKACQTTTTNTPPGTPQQEVESADTLYVQNEPKLEQAEFFYAVEPEPAVLVPTEQINFVEMEGMQIVLSNDFLGSQLISQVEEFNRGENPGVLMTIGEESVNIQADEQMPARGELSGQESNGATSDIAWTQVATSSYDSDADISRNDQITARFSPPVETPTIVSYMDAPLNFKCGTCGEAFKCLQDRQEHSKEHHRSNSSELNIVGAQIGQKKVKKIVVKPKKEEVDATEHNFDNLFTNKLKSEEAEQLPQQPTIEVQDDKRTALKMDLKFVCSICEAVLPNRKELQTHKLDIHNVSTDIRHKCATCGEAFPNEYKYTEHLRVHPLECRVCGKFFYRRQNIQLHMKRHLGIRPYKCDICEKSFLTKQKRDEHKNIHTGEAPLKCAMCDETFRRHSNLVQHRNVHHFNIKKKVKDFICPCGEVFHSKRKLAWHKEIHDSKPKSCAHCSEKFIHMASLTRHTRRAHNNRFVPKIERSSENVECPICKGVYLRSSLEVHIRNHSGEKPFTCLICNKDFTTKWNLKLHKWTHASRTAKPYKCDQCKGAFVRETDYVAHMNSHKSVRPYTCNYCGAQFIRKYNCQRHVKEHEKGKSFSCQICGKSFHRSYYLKDHMRVHSGLRPYACHICGKTSTTKSNHNKHVRIHHAREPMSSEN